MSGVSGNYSVTQTFTRNVEKADIKFARKHEGESLAKAPNQNIETGTRGAFKNSLSFLKDSLKGFFESPIGKKLEFLKDRIELRTIQKGEVATAQRSDRRHVALAGNNVRPFTAPSSNDTAEAMVMLKNRGSGSERLAAQLTVSLGKWLGEAEARAKENGTDLKTEMIRIATSLASSINKEDFATLHLPHLREIAAQLKSEFRHDKAEMLERIIGAFSQILTQENAVEKFHDTARTYITEFTKDTKMFWRTNDAMGGEAALKSLVAHGFSNEFSHQIGMSMKPMLLTEPFHSIDVNEPTHLDVTETQAKELGRFAESILQKLESFELTDGMKDALGLVSNDIAELRPGEKGPLTRQFFQNAIVLKGIAGSVVDSQTFSLAVRILSEALGQDHGGDTPLARETIAFREKFGDRLEAMLIHFGMPEYSRR